MKQDGDLPPPPSGERNRARKELRAIQKPFESQKDFALQLAAVREEKGRGGRAEAGSGSQRTIEIGDGDEPDSHLNR